MPRKQFTEEQIIATLRQAKAGMPVSEACRETQRGVLGRTSFPTE